MIRKYAERYRRWQQTMPLVSPFVIICGTIAVVYFFYRIMLIVSPAIMIERAAFNPVTDGDILCKNDENKHLEDSRPLLSAGYQKRVHGQRSLTPNMVANPNLTKIDPKTSQPAGYLHATENNDTRYDALKDGDKSFLRMNVKKTPQKDRPSPAWQIDPVGIKKHKTYAYSFWYRSGTDVNVSLEYAAHGKPQYSPVTTLKASRSWQQFTAHFNNNKEASSLRVNLSLADTGWIDTRSFDIHEIPDARLRTGLASVTFDDGWQSVNDKAWQLLNKYGIRSTQYIISDAAKYHVFGYMNFDTLIKFKKAGHEIGSHTLTHCNQTILTQENLEQNAVKSKQTLEQQGLGSVTSFAYPLGQYDHRTQATYEKHYPLIRTSEFGYNDRYFDETNIRSVGVNSTTSDDEFRSWLAYAKSHRLWVVFVYHQVDMQGEYSVTSAQLERQLRMLADSGLKTQPLSEAAASIRK